MVTWRSPKEARSHTREANAHQALDFLVRPDCFPAAASRRMRSWVERATCHTRGDPALAELFRKGGAFSSRLAVTSTWVSPNLPGRTFSMEGCARFQADGTQGIEATIGVAHGVYILKEKFPRYLAALALPRPMDPWSPS